MGCGYKPFISGLLLFFVSAFSVSGATYSVEVTATPRKVANPGEIVTHVFTVQNLGTKDDLYLLKLEVPEAWEFFPKQSTLAVSAGETGYLFVNLIVPPQAPAGTYTIALEVTSSGDPTVTAEASTQVEVLPHRDLELAWVNPPGKLQVGGETTWTLSLRNTGNVPDVYLVELERFGEWRAVPSATEVHLLPGEEEAVEIRAEVPPRAEPGAGYSLRVTVTSFHDPMLKRELQASGHFLPPPPELVPRSLYPQWDATLGARLGSEGNPRFSFRGSGEIELFGYRVNAGIGASIGGLDELRLSWDGGGKSFYLHGGGISGLLLGVSGKPLFGGEIAGLGRWRALFTPQIKGISFTGETQDMLLGFMWGGNSSEGYSFQDVGLRWEAPAGIVLWGTVSQGTDASSAGSALQLGGELSRDGFRLRVTYLGVSPGYPRHPPRDELSLRWESLTGAFPVDISYRFAALARESSPGVLLSHEFRASVSPDLPLQPRFNLSFVRRFHSPPPRDVDERAFELRISLRGGEPLPWNASVVASLKDDFATGSTTGSLSLSGSLTARTDVLELSLAAGVTGPVGEGAEVPSSSFTLRIRFPGAIGTPTVSFRAGGARSVLTLSVQDIPTREGEADGSFSYTLEDGKSRWEASFSLRFSAAFPFLGPTRGRIRGRVFIDRDGDFSFGPGDEGVEGLLLEADGAKALSGKGGIFVFPPLLPGKYRISFVEPPPEFTPSLPLPEVEVERGAEAVVEIPLRPRAWLKVTVFHDTDKDGTHDPGEAGVSGVELVISGEGGEWRLKTEVAGLVSLELPPGRYAVGLVEETLPERYVLTTPARVEVEVPEYGVAEVSFGVYQKPKPVVVTFAPPQAVISFTPEEPRAREPVTFDGTGSKAFGAVVTEYRWEFRLGDLRLTASGPTVTVSFPKPGDWTVILIVVDSQGRMGAARATVSVSP